MTGRKNKTPPPELPPEILLFHILPKLSAKFILRCKCVCKQWRSFLTSPEFVKIHLHHVTTVDRQRHEKILFSPTAGLILPSVSPHKFQTIGCEDGLVSTPRCYPLASHIANIISPTVNGLACLAIGGGIDSDLILWNPFTGEYKTISRPIDKKCYSLSGIAFALYYTCSDADYKILRITSESNAYIYSLKSDTWRKHETTFDNGCKHIPYYKPSGDDLLNEKLHYLQLISRWTDSLIIKLDLKTEKFTKIQVPFVSPQDRCLSLKIVRGSIELKIWRWEPTQFIIEVFKLDGDGDRMKMVTSSYFRAPRIMIKPLYLMKNGNWLAHTIKGISRIDLEKKIEEELYSHPELIILPRKYVVTFVSPNQYTNNNQSINIE